jgi:uncharacterized protein with NRDE domain
MCIILLAYRSHPLYRLVLAANRDEYYERPTAPASFWEDAPDVLAGRDLLCGGTWLGVTTGGTYAAVTNFRDPGLKKRDALSRGLLVSNYLRQQTKPGSYLERLAASASQYNGFNLLVGNSEELYYFSNQEDHVQRLRPGLYGLSNHLLNTPWPKVERGKQALSSLISNDEVSTEAIFEMLADRTISDDHLLPQTGVGLEVERLLSSVFISSPIYGTRSSTILMIEYDGSVTFIERNFLPGLEETEEVRHQFRIRTTI